MKRVQIRSFSWSVFSRIRTENGEIRSISRIQSECRKIRTRKNSGPGYLSRSESGSNMKKKYEQWGSAKKIWYLSWSLLSIAGNKAKGWNGGNEKTKPAKFSEKRKFLTSLIFTCMYRGVWSVSFSGILTYFVFLLPPFEIRPFA